jgi:hypothetical protein
MGKGTLAETSGGRTLPPEGATAQREFAGDWVVARELHSSKLFDIDTPPCYNVCIPTRERKK